MTTAQNNDILAATNPVLTDAPTEKEELTDMSGAKMTALYCRLSQEDERLGESLSIEHQNVYQEKSDSTSEKTADTTDKPNRRAGRPVGSKNRKTLEREAEIAKQQIVTIKRGRGRPAGSKDKQPRIRRWQKKPIIADNRINV